MTDLADAPALDSPPTATQIAELREQASEDHASVQVTYSGASGETKRFVVSPRGTCVVLQDLREDSFAPSVAPEDVAEALRE